MKQFWIVLLLYGIILFSLTGCGHTEGEETLPAATDTRVSGEGISLEPTAGGLPGSEYGVGTSLSGQSDLFSIPGFQGGAYQVKDFLTSNIYAVGNDEIYGYLDTILLLTEDIFCYEGLVMPFDWIDLSLYVYDNRDDLEEAFQVDMKDWIGERESVKMIPMTSPYNEKFSYYFGSTIFVVNNHRDILWVYWEGVFFLLERLPYPDMEILEDQTFDLELNDFGQVTFVCGVRQDSYKKSSSDIIFFLAKGDEIVYVFPSVRTLLYSKGESESYEKYTDVEFVVLADYDSDGDKDVIVGLEAETVSVRDDSRSTPHLKIQIYEYSQGEFVGMDSLSSYINSQLSIDYTDDPGSAQYSGKTAVSGSSEIKLPDGMNLDERQEKQND